MAKTRVVLIKILTVPRLELQSAVMATRLALFIKKEHSLHVKKVVFWSDSQTVLGWVRSDARKYHPFVAHRIAEILDSTSPTDWRWVPTAENVADEATRNKSQEILQNLSRWLNGLKFLYKSEDEWPVQKAVDKPTKEVTTEMRKEFLFIAKIEPPVIDSEKFSSWQKITRVTAWAYRFSDRCRKRTTVDGTWELASHEIIWAEDYLLQRSQRESFPEDWKRLEHGQEITSSSKILTLSPVFRDGFIRMDGRVTSDDGIALQPIILDSKNDIVKLLIRHYHERSGHNGRERLINDLREKFWITNIRSVSMSVSSVSIEEQSRPFQGWPRCQHRDFRTTQQLLQTLQLTTLERYRLPSVADERKDTVYYSRVLQ